jgi:hypothetical protein
MDHTGTGLIIVKNGPPHQVVIVQDTQRRWSLPYAPRELDAKVFAEAVRKELNLGVLTPLEDLVKEITNEEGVVLARYHLLQADSENMEINPYSEVWLTAKWATFDEAFHVVRSDQEEISTWAERQAKKIFR